MVHATLRRGKGAAGFSRETRLLKHAVPKRMSADGALAEKTSTGAVFKLSIPLFVELFMQLMMGNVNQVMVSPFGDHAVAAVGNALQVLNLVTIALSAMGTASTILVTRLVGQREQERMASEIATVSLATNVVFSLVVTIVLALFWPQLLGFLNVELDVRGMAGSFLLVVGVSTAVQGAFFALTALLRAYAHAGSVMVASLVMNAANVGLSVALLTGWATTPETAVEYVALANVVARVLGLAAAAWLVGRQGDACPRLRCLRPFPWSTLKRLLCVGVPASGEQMNYDIVQIVILSFVNVLGATVVTVKVYCSLIAGVAYLYSIALSQATQIVLGYLLAAGRLDAVARRVWMCDLVAAVLTMGISAVFWTSSDAILGLFTANPQVLALGKQVLFVEMLLSVGRALNIVMVRTLIALGDTRTPVAVNVFSSWLVAVGGGYLLGIGLGWGLVGMWIAMCVDEWLRATSLLVAFAHGNWRRHAGELLGVEQSAIWKRQLKRDETF